ncbi:MAG: MFS transporter [Thiolinea sp.]
MIQRPRHILPVIILSQFAATSLWFAGNAVLGGLSQSWGIAADAVDTMTTAVQAGFIIGTLLFALLALPDRFSPRKVFLYCALAGGAANALPVLFEGSYALLLASRFLTGFFLSGLYPVGMKIAAAWYQHGLGRAIGYLVGALVLGTAFPHLLNSLGGTEAWRGVLLGVSLLAAAGGILLFLQVPDGPFHQRGAPFDPAAILRIFHVAPFRASALGYFGHMWELYAFYAFVPSLLLAHFTQAGVTAANISWWAFVVIAMGSLGCIGGGLLSLRLGSARVAGLQLGISGLCCLLSPLLFFAPTPLFLLFLLVWGMTVAGDSPQFSALNAVNAPAGLTGSALTLANSIGFAISIVSIELLGSVAATLPTAYWFLLLLPGPLAGLWALRPLLRQ